MESTAVNVFVQVAETGSFVAAGRLLGISASAVGKRVSALEDQLGVRLFHRSTRSLTLTAEGGMFLARGRRILAELEAAQAELSQVNLRPRGRLRLSVPLVGEPFLSVMGQFKLAYPDVDLELEFTDRRVDIIEEGFDAVIRSGDAPDSRLTARRFGALNMLLVGAPDYLARRGTPRTAGDLAQHACIQFRYPNTGKLQVWPLGEGSKAGADGESGEAAGFPLSTAVVCNNLEARIAFALQGVGIAYLPDFSIRGYLRTGQLVQVLPHCTETGIPFHIMWPSGGQVPAKLRVFIDFMRERVFPEQVP
ncbi:LysR family transcriptional regulator [Pandoraea norimbergensis]|uniref:LysR family transcriptional regulator n=1 Tax=Pandoraea norimbergensis TaxID=93219 RepID=A0ABM5WPJ0_9BURK|nr:LysR family transcriptional regulator [Pandoraea norimbergensis]ALS62485.1 LysR family transcriptional regulator [Pandoraea norimbergensis]